MSLNKCINENSLPFYLHSQSFMSAERLGDCCSVSGLEANVFKGVRLIFIDEPDDCPWSFAGPLSRVPIATSVCFLPQGTLRKCLML